MAAATLAPGASFAAGGSGDLMEKIERKGERERKRDARTAYSA
jgi:hypothetical protein